VVAFLKRLLGRQTSSIHRTERGIEEWTEEGEGGLMVRKTNMKFLTAFLAKARLHEVARTAGQLTEAYTNFGPRWVKRSIYWLNLVYYRYLKWPSLAMGNIVFFRKGGR